MHCSGKVWREPQFFLGPPNLARSLSGTEEAVAGDGSSGRQRGKIGRGLSTRKTLEGSHPTGPAPGDQGDPKPERDEKKRKV